MAISNVLKKAIEAQKLRIKYNEAGEPLCRHCGKVCPPDYRMVYYLPNSSQVWGPCCSNECIAHTKICSGCNKDFFVDNKTPDGKDEIEYIGDGVSYCQECLKDIKSCDICGKRGILQETPDGKPCCKSCYSKHYFKCPDCTKDFSQKESYRNLLKKVDYIGFLDDIDITQHRCLSCFKTATHLKVKKEVNECACCGNIYGLSSTSNKKYCQKCIDNEYIRQCFGCGDETHDYTSKKSRYFCNKCIRIVQQCKSCKEYDISSKMNKIKLPHSVSSLCRNCSGSSKITECKDCFSPIVGSASCYCETKKIKCSRCGEAHLGEPNCRSEMGSHLMNYSYKPIALFNYINQSSQVFFGFENEINYNCTSDYHKAIASIYKNYKPREIYCKPDGSISGPGFEAVSGPMDLEYFNSMDLSHLFSVAPKEEDSSCGLHVHVARSSFDGKAHVYKFIDFINSHKNFIIKIAGRNYGSYNSQYTTKKRAIDAVKRNNGERYKAVNVTNSNTYEVRMFKSARNEYQLRYRIEFVNALVEFTRNSSMKKNTVEEFVKSVSPSYKNLYRWLSENPTNDRG